MWKCAVKGLRVVFEESYDGLHARQALGTGNKLAVYTHNNGHNAKAGAAGSNYIAGGITFAGQTTGRVPKIPEIFEGLLLYQGKQGIVGYGWEFIG